MVKPLLSLYDELGSTVLWGAAMSVVDNCILYINNLYFSSGHSSILNFDFDCPCLSRIYSTYGCLLPLLEMATSTFADRPLKTLVLFDVDGTLTPARQVSRLSFQPTIHHLSL
jgi:hypothetical protein